MPAFVAVEVDNDGFKVYDSAGTLIDPAEDATVAAITTALNAIKDTDGIKKITDPVAVTDNGGSLTVDGPLTDTELRATAVPVSAASLPLPAGAATEATLATLATEAKLEAVRALLATIDADTGVLVSVDYATETTQATLATEVKLEAVRVLLASLDAKDYATQTTLAAILVDTGQIETLLTTIDADTSNLDVALSTRASESTLSAADTKLGTIDSVLDSIKDTDGIKKIQEPLPAGTGVIGKVRLVDEVDHEYTSQHMGGTDSTAAVTGTHALFTHDPESQKFLKLMVNSLKRIEIMLEHATEVQVGDEEDEDD